MNHQSQDFAGLRQCFQEVSRRNWERLKEVLQEWEPETLPLALEYCERHLEHWPDELRVVTESDASEVALSWWPLAKSFAGGEPDVTLQQVRLLGEHPDAPPLTRLRLGDYYTLEPSEVLPCFLENPQFAEVEALDSSGRWDNGILLKRCVERAVWKRVRELSFDWHPEMIFHLDSLLHPFWSSLERLDLRIQQYRTHASSSYLLPLIMGAPTFQTLKHLSLHCLGSSGHSLPVLYDDSTSRFRIELPGVGELQEVPSMNALESLVLRGVSLPLHPWQKWLNTGASASWETLTLQEVPLSHAHLEALCSSPSVRGLRTLRLIQCGLDDHALQPLLTTSNLPVLQTLELMDNELTERFTESWRKTPGFAQLKSLNLRRNNISKKFKRKLKHLPGVEA